MHSTGPQSPRRDAQPDKITDPLAALDWHEFTCQADGGCTSHATHIVHRHAVDKCNQPGLDPFGNVVAILCVGCVDDLTTEVSRRLDRISRGPHVYCLTCGAPVNQLNYVIRKVVRLTRD